MKRLKIALQKKGRLHDGSEEILKKCGIKFNTGLNSLIVGSSNFPIEVLMVRDDDIPQIVADGVAHIGIVGENEMLEKDKEVDVVYKLGFSKCRLSLAIPKNEEWNGVKDLEGKEIATSYPHIVKKYLEKNGVSAGVQEISGSVEIAPGIGLTDAICDLVSSGSTLFMNGLKEVETVLTSEAVMIGYPNLEDWQQEILDKLLFRIKAVQAAKNNKYILLNAPNENLDKILKVLPGMKSPTVLPLAEEGWSSVHTVIAENDFWDIIDSLKGLGAQGILVVPIEKMII